MPGRNSNFNPADKDFLDRCFAQKVHYGVIFAVAAVETIGMTRFYYIMPELRYSLESFLLTAFFIIADVLVITAMLRSKNEDPGYLIPSHR